LKINAKRQAAAGFGKPGCCLSLHRGSIPAGTLCSAKK
jgi:hypothetical protein